MITAIYFVSGFLNWTCNISEPKKENVTLTCSPRPPDESLTRVKWFLDGELLKELPECSLK